MKQVKHAGLYIGPCKEEQKKDLAHQVLYEAAGLRTQVPTKTRDRILPVQMSLITPSLSIYVRY